MASCDDDFVLLGEEAESNLHSQQQQQTSTAGDVPLSANRYIIARPITISTVASPKKGNIGPGVGDEDHEVYGEAFAQADVNPHHCFAEDDDGLNPFGPSQPPEDSDVDRDHDIESKPCRITAAMPDSHHHHYPSRAGPKFNDGDYLSDDESPYGKRTRPSSGDYRKDREWSDLAIECLLDVYTEKYIQLNRGNLRGRDWEDVAITVSERCDKQRSCKSVEQCKNKVDNLKKRYKVESQRLINGNHVVSHWPWFKKMELIVGSSSSSKATPNEEKAAVIAGSSPRMRQMQRYPVALLCSASLTSNLELKSLSNPRWKRVVFRISGAALAGTGPQNVDPKVTMLIAREVAMASRAGVQVALVVGGRNFFCADTWVAATGTDRATTHQICMMASAMNAILLQASFEKIGVEARVQSAFMMQENTEPYIRQRSVRHLDKGRIVIFGGIGARMGNPLFTTDTASAFRASEINADAVLKGTSTDGVNDCHSRRNSSGFEHISFRDLISRGFSSMDMTAVTFCEENNIPVVLFNLLEPGNISRALCGDQVGTLVDQSGSIS